MAEATVAAQDTTCPGECLYLHVEGFANGRTFCTRFPITKLDTGTDGPLKTGQCIRLHMAVIG